MIADKIREMVQNRIIPFGDIVRMGARGTWMGNPGQLHGKGKDWIRCRGINTDLDRK